MVEMDDVARAAVEVKETVTKIEDGVGVTVAGAPTIMKMGVSSETSGMTSVRGEKEEESISSIEVAIQRDTCGTTATIEMTTIEIETTLTNDKI